MNDIASSDDGVVLIVPSDGSVAGGVEDEVGIGVDVALISGTGVGEDGVDSIDFSVDVGGEVGRSGLDGGSPDGAVESIEVSGDDKVVE